MFENFEKKKYESFGIDLHDFCKETMIKRFENVQVTGINVLVLIAVKGQVESVKSKSKSSLSQSCSLISRSILLNSELLSGLIFVAIIFSPP